MRNTTVDLMRTLAIVLMVVFHFIYDLRTFGYHQWDIPDGPGWKHFRYVILTLFFLCVGIGLVYAHSKIIHWQKFWKREFQVLVGALLVTAMSLVMFPANWIYFGVLHFIVLASVLALPFLRYPKLALVAAIVLIAGYNLGLLKSFWPFHWVAQTWPGFLPAYANDWVPLIPWLAVVWLGIWLAHQHWFTQDPLKAIQLPAWAQWPGRHSLLVYLMHQPLLVGGLHGWAWLTQ